MREMKDSGIKWLNKIPIGWKVARLKDIIQMLTDYTANGSFGDLAKNVQYLDYEDYARLIRLTDLRENLENSGVYVSEYSYDYLAKSSLYGGEILVANVGAYAGLFCEMPTINMPSTLGPNMFLIRTNPKMLQHYLYYLGNADFVWKQLVQKAMSSAQPKLNKTDVKTTYIIIPPIQEQKKIADFLDAKCSEINALTADIQTQIDTLEQYKRSVITEAVTKGSNPDVEMKDSGNQYWGRIPTNWHLSDIKYLFEIVKRIAGKEGYDILSVTQKGIKIKDISNNEGQVAESYANYQFVYPGDFVMNHMDLLTGWVDCSKLFGVTSPDYRVFRLRDKNNSLNYYKYIMQTCYMNRIFYSLGQGVSNLGRWRLQTSSFNNFMVPVPPVEVQESIATYLDKKCTEINACIDDKQRQLEVLEEYKKSLIYEYVTGKKEVPAI